MIAIKLFSDEFSNKCINFYCDNMAVVDIINIKTSKDSEIMVLMRRLAMKCMKTNILFRATQVPGKMIQLLIFFLFFRSSDSGN